nr:hypothetical protein [Succinivibrionaceae bacterium]
MRACSLAALHLYRALMAALNRPLVALLCHARRRDPPYGERRQELFGRGLPSLGESVIFHGASMGEVMAARPLIRAFHEAHPGMPLVVSTRTTTGMAAAQGLPATAVYLPLESALALRRFFGALRPRLMAIIDTELWPALFYEARQSGCRLALVNARLREKSVRGYRRIPGLTRDLLLAPLSLVMARSEEDCRHFCSLGVPEEIIRGGGNIKFDLSPDEGRFNEGRAAKPQLFPDLVLGALSTHGSEAETIIAAYLALRGSLPGLSLVLVPRHASDLPLITGCLRARGERFLLRDRAGVPLATAAGEDAGAPPQGGRILIGATTGEMERYLGLIDLAFMGGSLVDIGGHNPLEPAHFGIPTVTGPIYYNFREEYALLCASGAATAVAQAGELEATLRSLLKSGDLAARGG